MCMLIRGGICIHFVSQEMCPSGFVSSVPGSSGLNALELEMLFEVAVSLASGAWGGFGIVE